MCIYCGCTLTSTWAQSPFLWRPQWKWQNMHRKGNCKLFELHFFSRGKLWLNPGAMYPWWTVKIANKIKKWNFVASIITKCFRCLQFLVTKCTNYVLFCMELLRCHLAIKFCNHLIHLVNMEATKFQIFYVVCFFSFTILRGCNACGYVLEESISTRWNLDQRDAGEYFEPRKKKVNILKRITKPNWSWV